MIVPFIKKRIVFILFVAFFFSTGIYCQVHIVSGLVTSSEVVVSGTKAAAITNIDGIYSIEVPAGFDSLEFNYLGMEPKKILVSGIEKFDLVMQPKVYTMDAVVVTALGITRDAKSIGYSVTAVNNDEIAKSNDRSVLNSLQGKIAGVNISSASGAPGSSTRVMMRGVSSLTGGNQPLVVVNGVAVNNSQSGSSSINGGTDFGNKINDINPDDIESVSFLKGAAGTVQYGSRASNGVIIITTKSGKQSSKTQVTFNTSVGFDKPLRLVEYQNEFGQGLYGNTVLYENTSWGPRFDNKYHPWGNKVDNEIRVKAYSALPNNVEEFFETGRNYNNSLSISGGTEQTTYYFSYNNVISDGIFPTNADSYLKHSFTLNASHKISNKLKTATSVNYIDKKSKYVSTGQGGQSVYNQVMQTPRDISLREVSDLNNKYNTIDNYYSLYTVNPYFVLKNNSSRNEEDRVMFSLDFNYNPFKNTAVIWRMGGDVSNENRKEWKELIEPQGNNEFSSVFYPGLGSKSAPKQKQLSSDLMLTYKIEKQNWSLDLLVGQSLNQRSSSGLTSLNSRKATIGFNDLSNTLESTQSSEGTALIRMAGAYGSADFSYRNLLFFSVNARNDWSSTLPKKNNSYFFPGANIGLIFTDLFPILKSVMPYGKIRVSWARVGNDADPYLLKTVFPEGIHSDGYGYFKYPLSNGVTSYDVGNLIPNNDLKPELTEEYEFGAEVHFLNNRISLDATYYQKSTTDLIWPSPVAYSSGFTSQLQNLGKLSNNGIEAMITFVPVKTRNFSWEFTVNYTQNKNKLVYLNNKLDEAELNALRVDGGSQISWVALPGEPVGVFKVRTPKYTSNGKMVVDNQGLPIADDTLTKIGNSQYRFFGGFSNQLTYKNISVSFRFDFREGGIMYSQTKAISYFAGTTPATLYNDREPFIIPNSVVKIGTDSKGNPIYSENTKPISRVQLPEYWSSGGSDLDRAFFVDKSFVKLREVVISYEVPQKFINKLPFKGLNFSVIGKNLLLWTPSDQTFIDPEQTTFGNDFIADFGEYGAQPSTRSLIINLRAVF
jgi:TonB-linked SusC/RagA family outer membrane protein